MKPWKGFLILELYGLGAVVIVSLTWALGATMLAATEVPVRVRDLPEIMWLAGVVACTAGLFAGVVATIYGVPAYFVLWRLGLANLFTTSLVALLPALLTAIVAPYIVRLAGAMAGIGLPVAWLVHWTARHCLGPGSRYHVAATVLLIESG